MSKKFPLDKLRWIGVRFRDPTGRTFEFEGEYFRAIYPSKVEFVKGLIGSGVVERLVNAGVLIETSVTSHEVDGYGLVLKHKKAPFPIGSHEWPRTALRDAAKVYLTLNLELLRLGLGTVDAHLGNFSQVENCRPVWLDFGSITSIAEPRMGISQYRACIGNPLKLLAANANLLPPVRAMLQHGGLGDVGLKAFGFRGPTPAIDGMNFPQKVMNRLLPAKRETYLKRELERLPQTFPSLNTYWERYQSGGELPAQYSDQGARRSIIHQIIQKLRPKRVIDLASNAGFFSFMAARQGAEVLAVDYDPGALEALYKSARDSSEKLAVSVIWGDVTLPREVPVQGDLVLALALVHHLSISQEFPFDHIARCLRDYCTDVLITEFMPNGIGGRTIVPNPLPAWYTLEGFVSALRSQFRSVEVIDYAMEPENSPRTLLMCREPIRG